MEFRGCKKYLEKMRNSTFCYPIGTIFLQTIPRNLVDIFIVQGAAGWAARTGGGRAVCPSVATPQHGSSLMVRFG